jgi:Tol biopolymer transport system component
MRRRKRLCRLCSIATCAGVLAGSATTAAQKADQSARLVAIQRIRAEAATTLDPPALSDDGRFIAFVSQRHEPLGRACCQKVYVLDRSTGLITDESIVSDGTATFSNSRAPSLSPDGRFVAFETVQVLSSDPALVLRQVVVRDRETAAVHMPRSVNGATPAGRYGNPVVTENGLAVVFTSNSTNLVPGPRAVDARTDIYLWRLDDETITRISVPSKTVGPPVGASYSPSVSRDGKLVAFVSTARLVEEDTNSLADVYLRDVRRGITSLVSRGAGGRPANGPNYSPALSADGRYLAFVSGASNLAPRDRNQQSDVYLYDVTTESTTLVSATSRGVAGNATSRRPAISADGRYVVYQSLASNLGSEAGCPHRTSDTNLLPDVYLFDRMTRCVTRVSGSNDREWWTPSLSPAIAGSGNLVVFSSTQPTNDDDLSTDFDLFLFRRW